jgi:hypothetical protein
MERPKMARITKQETKQAVDPTGEAREKVAAVKAKLAEAERAEFAARVAEGAITPDTFNDPAAFRTAKAEAAKRTADASSDVAFYGQKLAEAEVALRPLEVAEAQAAHEAARAKRTEVVAALAAKLDVLPALLDPVAAAVREVAMAHAAVRSTGTKLERLDARVPYDGGEETMAAERVSGTKLGEDAASMLMAIGAIVGWFEGAGAREAQRRQAAEDREREQHNKWKGRAMAGELGPEERKRAEAVIKAETDLFYGRHPERNVNIGMPRIDPTVEAYRKNAGIDDGSAP